MCILFDRPREQCVTTLLLIPYVFPDIALVIHSQHLTLTHIT